MSNVRAVRPVEIAPKVRAAWTPKTRGWAKRPALAGELGVALGLLLAYDRIAGLATLRITAAQAHAQALLALESTLHVGGEAGLNSFLVHVSVLRTPFAAYYTLAHGTVTFGMLALLYVRSPAHYRAKRRALLAINAAALLIFFSWPVAPPRLFPSLHVVDVVAASHVWGAWPASVTTPHADQFAAMPSLHIAWAGWVLLSVLHTTSRCWARSIATLHVALTVVVVLTTANHYVLDVAGGAALCLLATVTVADGAVARGRDFGLRCFRTVRATRSPGLPLSLRRRWITEFSDATWLASRPASRTTPKHPSQRP